MYKVYVIIKGYYPEWKEFTNSQIKELGQEYTLKEFQKAFNKGLMKHDSHLIKILK